eukprot:jgi/Mesvir1/20140/Mv13379-RA.1
MDESSCKVFIWIPDGYEDVSRLANYLMNREIPIGDLAYAEVALDQRSPGDLFVPYFYVRAKEYPNWSEKYERDAFSTVGRRMLCHALQLMRDKLPDPETANINLEASGGECHDIDNTEYVTWSMEKCKTYLQKFTKS